MKKKLEEQQPTQPVEPTLEDVQKLAATIKEQWATIMRQDEELDRLYEFEQGAKKLLHMYDTLDEGDYQLYLDSFVLVARKKFKKEMTVEEMISMRQDMSNFIESRMTEETK